MDSRRKRSGFRSELRLDWCGPWTPWTWRGGSLRRLRPECASARWRLAGRLLAVRRRGRPLVDPVGSDVCTGIQEVNKVTYHVWTDEGLSWTSCRKASSFVGNLSMVRLKIVRIGEVWNLERIGEQVRRILRCRPSRNAKES